MVSAGGFFCSLGEAMGWPSPPAARPCSLLEPGTRTGGITRAGMWLCGVVLSTPSPGAFKGKLARAVGEGEVG